MEATAVNSSSTTIPDLKSVGRITLTWAKKHLLLALVGGLIWGGICWAINVFLIIVYYDGWGKVPPGGMATAQTNLLWGGLFWALVSSILFSFLGYLRSRRTETAVEDKQKYNEAYREARRSDPAQFKSHFLMAVALGAVLFRFFDTLVLVFIASLFAARFSYLGFLTTTVFFRVWLLIAPMFPRSYQRVLNHTFSPILWLSATASGLLMGCLATYIGGFFLSPEIVLLLILFYCLTQADRGSTNQPSSPAGTVTAVLIMVGAFAAMRAFADDGGWRESGGSIQGLLQNEGFKPSFLWAVPGGLSAWIGYALGLALSDMVLGNPIDIDSAMRAEMEMARARARAELQIKQDIDRAHEGTLYHHRPLPIVYQYIPSPNSNERPTGTDVSTVVLHATASSDIQSAIDTFLSEEEKTSAHFVVGKDGRVVQMVPVEQRAWHAGKSEFDGMQDVNNFSVGIEIVNRNDGVDPYTPEQIHAVAGIIRYVRSFFDVSDDHIVSHAEIAVPAGRKTDPAGLDIDTVRNFAGLSSYDVNVSNDTLHGSNSHGEEQKPPQKPGGEQALKSSG